MKTILLISTLILTFSLEVVAKDKKINSFDLSVEVELEDGKTKNLSDIIKRYPKNKPILVYLWASWCSDCAKEAPHLDKYLKDNPSKVSMLYFSVDEKRTDWIKKKKSTRSNDSSVRYAAWKDEKFKKSIKLDWIPRYVLINHKGDVLHSYAIKIEDDGLIKAINDPKK